MLTKLVVINVWLRVLDKWKVRQLRLGSAPRAWPKLHTTAQCGASRSHVLRQKHDTILSFMSLQYNFIVYSVKFASERTQYQQNVSHNHSLQRKSLLCTLFLCKDQIVSVSGRRSLLAPKSRDITRLFRLLWRRLGTGVSASETMTVEHAIEHDGTL